MFTLNSVNRAEEIVHRAYFVRDQVSVPDFTWYLSTVSMAPKPEIINSANLPTFLPVQVLKLSSNNTQLKVQKQYLLRERYYLLRKSANYLLNRCDSDYRLD